MERLKVFEGMPLPYSHLKTACVPKSMRILRLRGNRKYCELGDLCNRLGWK